MDVRSFFVPGKAISKQRPRRTSNMKRMYTPAKTTNAEAMVRFFYQQEFPGASLFEGPITLHVLILHDVPEKPKWLAEWRATHETPYRGNQDWDNLGKLISDALNKVAWKDDAQVFDARVVKRYCLGNENPGTLIVIEHHPELMPVRM